jgi:hypothetical protein
LILNGAWCRRCLRAKFAGLVKEDRIVPAERRWTQPGAYVGGEAFRRPDGASRASRFYFHLREDGSYRIDADGMELSNLAEVRREALRAARLLVAAERMAGKSSVGSAIEVEDEARQLVFTLPLGTVRTL